MNQMVGDAGRAETPAPDIAAAPGEQGASSVRLSGETREPGLRAAGEATEKWALSRVYRPNDIQYRAKQRRTYGKDEVLNELRRVALLATHPVLSYARFRVHSRLSREVFVTRFGSWRGALERVGLGHRYSGRPLTHKQYRKPSRLQDAALLQALQVIASSGQRVCKATVEASPVLTMDVLRKRFGSFNGALLAAGLPGTRYGRRLSDADCDANLAMVWRHLGRAPHQTDMNRAPSTIGYHVYIRRHRTWRRALAVFALRASMTPENVGFSFAPPDAEVAAQVAAEQRRGARPALLLGVMQRDRFRCVLCGDSPAANPACVLQVDHLLPFSKGGRTEPQNLRTLCRTCNLGRGDRVGMADGAGCP